MSGWYPTYWERLVLKALRATRRKALRIQRHYSDFRRRMRGQPIPTWSALRASVCARLAECARFAQGAQT